MWRRLAVFTATIIVLGCKTMSVAPSAGGSGGNDLTWDEARARKERLSEVKYRLHVSLSDLEPQFPGQATIEFQLKDANRPLRIDFFEGEVRKLVLNGQDVPVSEAKKPYWIELPTRLLAQGRNVVIVDYAQAYSRQGQGLHRFTDPQSKQSFLHTQFQTFDANRFMPCFDQPDLRATLDLTVEAPANWEVISTSPETAVKAVGKARKLRTFATTPPIATYLFSLHGGPFKVWKDKFEDIPLRLYARPTMAPYVRADEWFRLTKQGLKFFNGFFAYKYPFKKYDQLFVPEFNAGAMENVAAVTFSERFLVRGEVTRDQRRGAAGVLMHEMAHMWFGDIVTMSWWNDLWLNESFATFMAALALHEATEFKEAWQDFFTDDKNWAYWEDSLRTTHAIEAPVPSVKVAYANFDGITYGKGAAVLKQLRAYITPEAFKKGIQSYIATHAFKNTELKDFIASLQAQTQRDLNLWSERWLRQSGTDRLSVRWTCAGKTLEKLELHTTPAEGRKFRPQTLQVALFQNKGGQLNALASVRADLTQPAETIQGPWPCPDFVYPNFKDEAYIAVALDPTSLAFAKQNLSRISDTLLRTMVWDDLWEMVRATELPMKDYVAVLEQHFAPETDNLILNQIVNTASGRRGEDGTLLAYWPDSPERSAFLGKMESEFLRRLRQARPGSDDQKFWFDSFVRLARTKPSLDLISAWLTHGRPSASLPRGLKLDIDREWSIAFQLTRFRHPEASAHVARLKAKDTSDRGVRSVLAVDAVQPAIETKRKWIAVVQKPKPELSYAEARAVLGALFPLEQRELAKPFAESFYEYLRSQGESENENFVEGVAGNLAPLNCESTASKRLDHFLGQNRLSPSVNRLLLKRIDEDERCQKVRAAHRSI